MYCKLVSRCSTDALKHSKRGNGSFPDEPPGRRIYEKYAEKGLDPCTDETAISLKKG